MGVGDETSKGMIGEKAMLDFLHVLHQRPVSVMRERQRLQKSQSFLLFPVCSVDSVIRDLLDSYRTAGYRLTTC